MSENRAIKHDILTRVRFLYLVFIVAGAILLLRIFYVQLFSVEVATNAEKIYGRIFHSQSIKAQRGSILSRSGEPLATSILRYQVEMDFGSEGFDSLNTYYRQSDSLSKLLSAYFKDRSAAEYRKMFRTNREKHYQLKYRKDSLVKRSEGWFSNFVDFVRGDDAVTIKLYDTIRSHRPVKIFPREVDYAEWQLLRRYPILNWNMGMTYRLVDRDNRVYAQAGLARRTIGEIKEDRGDDYGIEKIYNEVLQGEDGRVLRQRIARGFYGRVVGGESHEAIDGKDVLTTIDVEIQDLATRALRRQLEKEKSAWGTTIVMEVETGDILAIANLDRLADGRYSEQRNRAIGARAEPGSTFKLAASLALLDVARMPTTKLYDSGDGKRVKVGKTRVQDSHKGYSEVNIQTAFEQSLNGFFAQAVYEHFKDDPTQYTDYLKHLHLDRPMGLELFGEPEPRLPVQGSKIWWDDVTIVNMAYGYGVELTPIQTLTLYNAVANDGRMVAPRLVKEIQHNGKTIESFPTRTIVERICSRPTLDTVRRYLMDVCESGTAKQFLGRFDGFKAAGKTGTAQFAQDGHQYRDGYYLGTMVGFMPAENPKYSVITVMLKRPRKGNTIYGGGMAGPVVKDVMQSLYNQEHEWHIRLDTIKHRDYPKKIKGGNIEAIKEVNRTLSPKRIEGQNSVGWGSIVSEKDDDASDNLSILKCADEIDKMPNVYGMGLRDALFILESRGLEVAFKGSGAVWRQSIRAGATIKRGTEVSIELR